MSSSPRLCRAIWSAAHMTPLPPISEPATTHSEASGPSMSGLAARPTTTIGIGGVDHPPGELVVVVVALLAVGQPAQPGADEPGDVLEEVDEDGRDGAHLDHGGEADDGVVVDRDAHQALGDLQVAGGGDRKELGHSLHDAENDGLADADGAH